MADRPILFSAPMVRALLAGRKSQARRVIKPRRGSKSLVDLFDGSWTDEYVLDPGNQSWREDAYPWRVGDRLYVREAHHRTNDSANSHLVGYDFAEDPNHRDKYSREIEGVGKVEFFRHSLGGWGGRSSRNYPGMHMPRWASRLTLTVTDVRVQRLQDISDRGASNDCTEEGVFHCGMTVPSYEEWSASGLRSSEKYMYRQLWDSLNAERPGCSWSDNPWVCAVSFTVDHRNIDEAA